MVVYHVDDALHAAGVDGVHQMEELLTGAVLGVYIPVIPDGIGAAVLALAGFPSDGMDGHQPDDIRAQGANAVQILFQRGKGALFGVIPHKYGIEDLIPQRNVGIFCHKNSSSFHKPGRTRFFISFIIADLRKRKRLFPLFSKEPEPRPHRSRMSG